MRFLIYALSDPRSREIRYIGKSSSGLARPRSYGYPSRQHAAGHLPVFRWVKKMEISGVKYDVDILEICTNAEEASEKEKCHIAYWRFIGADLLNLTDGGDGSIGCSPNSLTRLKMSVAKIGKQGPNKGKSPSKNTRAAQSKSLGARNFSDQYGTVYNTLRGAARDLGLKHANVLAVLKGRQKHTGGYVFKYVE